MFELTESFSGFLSLPGGPIDRLTLDPNSAVAEIIDGNGQLFSVSVSGPLRLIDNVFFKLLYIQRTKSQCPGPFVSIILIHNHHNVELLIWCNIHITVELRLSK